MSTVQQEVVAPTLAQKSELKPESLGLPLSSHLVIGPQDWNAAGRPVSRLSSTCRVLKVVMDASWPGSAAMALLLRRSTLKVVPRDPSWEGTELSWLSFAAKSTNSVRAPISVGIAPTMSFPVRYRYLRFVSRPISVGSEVSAY